MIEFTVPFSGEADAFKIRPSTYRSAPIASLRDEALILTISGHQLGSEYVKSEVSASLRDIKEHLDWLRPDVNAFNEQIQKAARNQIEQRRNRLLANQQLVASLGYRLKERPASPATYTAPQIRRKIGPSLPPASTKPYEPEPILGMADYEHILNVLSNMAMTMERSPSVFSGIDEEALRFHFLVQLNGHYEGQALGEAFNYEGKTDILIRVQGKNIFIAECKFWGGPKKLTETLDQLLRYVSWRDTKVAMLVFNRNKNFSQVLESIPETIKAHPQFKRESSVGSSETRSRYIIAHRDDPNRELLLTVLAFEVPRSPQHSY